MSDPRFTQDEANALLARVRPLAESMVERAHELARAEAQRAQLLARIAGNGGDMPPSELARAAAPRAQLLARIAGNGGDMPPSELAEATRAAEAAESQLARSVEALLALGVQVKDVRIGLVDFPSLRDGEEVLLCWRVGEDDVAFWHGLDEGYAGRKPL
jgi:hypothetical protein